MARPRKPKVVLASIDEANDAMRRLGLAVIRGELFQAALDREITAAKKRYAKLIATVAEEAKDLEAQLQHYYLGRVEEIERDGRRSLELLYGVMGRRTSPPALKLLNKSWTWAAVMVRLRDNFGDRFIRRKDPEIDKEAVKDGIGAEKLCAFGLKVEQDDVFYAEPDRAKVEAAC